MFEIGDLVSARDPWLAGFQRPAGLGLVLDRKRMRFSPGRAGWLVTVQFADAQMHIESTLLVLESRSEGQ